ncbi:MAG: MazF family transcriptional regulator [Pseudonocardiales bacterium]|nr:MazF family transcriptional regulator [Pseudonocardiales bacterium]
MTVPRRGELWTAGTDNPVTVLVISSTVYNEIPDEPTVIAVPVMHGSTDTGFCVDLDGGLFAVTGLVTHLLKTDLTERLRTVDVQTLTDVNTMLFKILATPER